MSLDLVNKLKYFSKTKYNIRILNCNINYTKTDQLYGDTNIKL